jgi:hypothetical protein
LHFRSLLVNNILFTLSYDIITCIFADDGNDGVSTTTRATRRSHHVSLFYVLVTVFNFNFYWL